MMISKGGMGCEVVGAPGSCQAEAEPVREEEWDEEKARGWMDCYGWRKRKREVMYVGGGLVVGWGDGAGGSIGQAQSCSQRHWPPIALLVLSAGWPLVLIPIYCWLALHKQ